MAASHVNISFGFPASMLPGAEVAPTRELPLSFQEQPLTAWRLWMVRSFARHGGTEEPRLLGIGHLALWPPRQRLEAECRAISGPLRIGPPGAHHEAPWPTHICGIWGFHTRELAEKALADYRGRFAIGRVYLWGRVLACANGYRAQYAYPRDLTIYDGTPEEAAELARVYGVSVTTAPAPERKEDPDPVFAFGSRQPLSIAPPPAGIISPQLAALYFGSQDEEPRRAEKVVDAIADHPWRCWLAGAAVWMPSFVLLDGALKLAGLLAASAIWLASMAANLLRIRRLRKGMR